MAGFQPAGGSLAMTLFGPRASEPSEEEAVSTPPPDPGLVSRVLEWLQAQGSDIASTVAATRYPPAVTEEAAAPMPSPVSGQPVMTRAQMPGQYGEDLGDLATAILAGRGGATPPKLPKLTGGTLEAAQSGRVPVPRYPDPDVRTMKKYFERGAKDPANVNWYTESEPAGQMLVGADEPLFRLYSAIFSQRKGPIPETDLAMKAYRAWKEGGVDALRTMPGPSTHQRAELIEGTLRFMNNPASNLKGALSPGSMKRRDYYVARGSEDVSVIDTHAGNVATRGQFQADDPRHYFGVQQVYHELADKAGVPRKGYQAAVWVPWREEQAALRGVPAGDSSPAARIVLARAERNPDWRALVRQGLAHAPPIDWRKMLLWSVLGKVSLDEAAAMSEAED